ncbi:DUF3000 domain-containing protein [Nesterenkonia populi]|uniref:DUF3000 domain-containing protein n=1 Tax=Nesterenkonia populi TaxID=1591087 RepID=UPI0011BE7CF4
MSVFGPAAEAAARRVSAAAGRASDAPAAERLPGSFLSALHQLRSARPRAEALVEEVPAPVKLAPYAVALRAEVLNAAPDPGSSAPRLRPVNNDEETLAVGRFILLHDPAGQESWGGTFRVVIYIRAELEPEMGNDPLLAEVAWTWLSDSLAQHGVRHSAAGGTATRILSESFGSLRARQSTNDVELRASWTPAGEGFDSHLEAWADMVCSFAGLPPLPDGVLAMPHIRRN